MRRTKARPCGFRRHTLVVAITDGAGVSPVARLPVTPEPRRSLRARRRHVTTIARELVVVPKLRSGTYPDDVAVVVVMPQVHAGVNVLGPNHSAGRGTLEARRWVSSYVSSISAVTVLKKPPT